MRKTTILLLLFAACCTVSAQPYWNNLGVYRLNKMQPHDRIIPDGDRWRLCLNGTWRFAYFDNPASATLSPARWDSIRVPGNIELQGFGVPVYVNMKNEFASNPPFAPTDYNPTGVYARSFSLPDDWRGRRTIIKFGAVKSAMYLYINGREVGYSQDSKTPAEWDITRYLRDGQNDLKVKVIRWCDGSYLECQDMWRMSGITRDVILYSVPQTYITDLKIVADLDTADWRTGRLDVMVDLNRNVQDGSVSFALYNLDGTAVDGIGHGVKLSKGDWFAMHQSSYASIQPWSDSTPTLYNLVVTLRDASGRETERISKRIGFRHVDIHNGLLRLNGRPMEIRGVNRHEHSIIGGHYITPDEMRRDIALMKELGINAVRTSHYPNDELWYDLCDSAGIYLWDEANVESHAQGYGEHSLAKNPDWLNPILDRIYNMYKRDRNHPSVIAWSLGNECGNGYCFEEAYRFLKGKDNTRPVVYERAELDWNTDIVAVMYPSVDFISQYARNPQNRRPYIIAEYCHAMGNSMGGLQDYWDTIDRYPQLQGGFVWDWIDQAFPLENGNLKLGNPTAAEQNSQFSTLNSQFSWAAGGDLGDLPGIDDDDNFCANGLLAADRTPHPHAAEVEAVYTRGRSNAVVPATKATVKRCALDYDIRHSADKCSVRIENSVFSLVVSLADGAITSYTYRGRQLLSAPLRWHFWRPPTDNDLVDPRGARAWQGLDRLQAECLDWATWAESRDAEGEFNLSMLLRLSTPDGASLRIKQILQANPAGQLQLSYQVVPGGHFSTLPVLGLQLGLDTAAFSSASFYGNIRETYPDRRSAQRVGQWYKTLAELAEPQYVVPQEQGRREARWVRFAGEGCHLTVVSPQEQQPLGFSVRRWSDSTLTAARRWNQVGQPDPFFTVTVDHRAAGLGTATCGPAVADPYIISGDSSYTYRFIFDPTGSDPSVEPFGPHPDLQQPLPADEAGLLPVKAITASVQPSAPYGKDFPQLLSDNRRAVSGDWQHGWAGWSNVDTLLLSLTLDTFADLGAITVGACHSPSDWVMRPLDIEAQWSIDGRRWSPWQRLELQNPPSNIYTDSRRLLYSLAPRRARKVHHVRLRISSRPTLPPWHPFAFQPAWLMLDELQLHSPQN